MKIISNVPLIEWIVRKIGNGDRARICIVKREKRKPSESKAQSAARNRFRDAAIYASKQMLDGKMKALYESRINTKMRSAYSIAVKDALTAPTVHAIETDEYEGRVGDVIIIHATDDFAVVRVNVQIKDAQGKVIEHGDAVSDEHNSGLWKYVASKRNKHCTGTTISVAAFDFPGNTATLEQEVPHQCHRSTPEISRLPHHKIARS